MTLQNDTIKKICFVTGTRADYGLLYWTMKKVQDDPALQLQLCVTGTHLSEKYGMTIKQIESDGFPIDQRIDIELNSDTPIDILHSMSLANEKFGNAFKTLDPDAVFILGDRFEMLAVATAATMSGIPIAHAHGGEVTLGANDDKIRHSITKMASVHFTSTDVYERRVIQMGEHPFNVHNVGAFGFENIKKLSLLDKPAFEQAIDFQLGDKSAVVTFHPETMDAENTIQHLKNLIDALTDSALRIIFTYPNADHLGEQMIKLIDDFGNQHADRVKVIPSLGQLNFLSSLQHVNVVIGNSSSGIIEAPSFKIPTVDIGERQKGRITAKSVINCNTDKEAIAKAIEKALSDDFKKICQDAVNPYEKENTSGNVIEILKTTNFTEANNSPFFDIK